MDRAGEWKQSQKKLIEEIRRLADPDLQCPGKEKCTVYLTTPEECIGGKRRLPGCLNKNNPGIANGQPSNSFFRAIQLATLQRSGCSLLLADLSPMDWMLLEALREGRELAAQDAKEKRGSSE